jgi:excisionase family DNA binding protein
MGRPGAPGPAEPAAAAGRITLDEAAERLGVHYMTVYKYVRTGRLRAEKVGRSWRVDPADLAALDGPAPARPSDDGSEPAARFEARLLAGDETGAWAVVEEELVNGRDAADVIVEIVAAAMASIGERWHQGELSVVDEHRATGVATRIVGRLGPRFARRGPARGTVVLGAPAGDHHALPTSIVRDLLRGEHLEVVDLGADVPAASWREAVAGAADSGPSLVAVGIGVSAAGSDEAVREAIAAVRSVSAVPIIVGGVAAPPLSDAPAAVVRTATARQAVETIVSLL